MQHGTRSAAGNTWRSNNSPARTVHKIATGKRGNWGAGKPESRRGMSGTQAPSSCPCPCRRRPWPPSSSPQAAPCLLPGHLPSQQSPLHAHPMKPSTKPSKQKRFQATTPGIPCLTWLPLAFLGLTSDRTGHWRAGREAPKLRKKPR